MLASDKVRRLIPRWRSARATICTGELDTAPSNRFRDYHASSFFEGKLAYWTQNTSVELATEVIAAALVEGQRERAQKAAKFVLDHAREVTPSVVFLAKKIVDPTLDLAAGACSE